MLRVHNLLKKQFGTNLYIQRDSIIIKIIIIRIMAVLHFALIKRTKGKKSLWCSKSEVDQPQSKHKP